MGSLFGRKGRNETDGRRGDVAKKSASLLAAVTVAGGSAVVGLPQAEAAWRPDFIYWEKVDQDGKPLGGASFTLRFKGETRDWAYERAANADPDMAAELGKAPRSFGIIDNVVVEDEFNINVAERSDNPTGRYLLSDLDPRPGHFLIQDPYIQTAVLFNVRDGYTPKIAEPIHKEYKLEERQSPEGYDTCAYVSDEIEFVAPSPNDPYEVEELADGRFRHVLKKNAFIDLEEGTGWGEVTDKNFRPGAGGHWNDAIGYLDTTPIDNPSIEKYLYDHMSRIPDEFISDSPEPEHDFNRFENLLPGSTNDPGSNPIYAVGSLSNCRDPYDPYWESFEDPTPTLSTVTETVTETPNPSTTTVTPPTTTVTLPSTVTTTVTPPATTVTATPKTETTTATTTESATTTVTETPKTETVTETPQRETVTHTPEKETETVTETPQKETVTETPKTETVTHTPDKETVTETPKASTETKTSTVTAPQVTVTETPKQVTETTTLPQKTVTQQVPITVVENKTETVKVPPVTVTKTEKQEPTTVTATPEKVTETVKIPGEKTTVVKTQPGEPTTVRETVTDTPDQPAPDVPAVVEQPTPDAPVVDTPDTPVIPGAFSGTVVWDEDRSKTVSNGDERIPGLTVVAYKDGKEIARTTTDENGFYKFDGLEPGEYGIAVYGPDGGELFFDDKAATVVAGEEDTGNDWGFVREDAPAPAQQQEPATPVETVRMTLATTGANSYALAGLGAVLAALVALAVVSRRKATSQ